MRGDARAAFRVRKGTGWITLLRKELLRFWKVSFQTLAAPVLTSLLYLLVFAHVLLWLALGVGRPEIRLGGLLFWLSDLSVARHRFVRAEPLNRLVGLPLYYAGQYLIDLALA